MIIVHTKWHRAASVPGTSNRFPATTPSRETPLQRTQTRQASPTGSAPAIEGTRIAPRRAGRARGRR
jgi:hypothetical protein